MLFTHFYPTQGKQVETRFVSPASRVYFKVEPKTFLLTNWQKIYPLVKWIASDFVLFYFEDFLQAYIAYPLRSTTIDLLFISKILVFEIKS